jgi:hypothetical protein
MTLQPLNPPGHIRNYRYHEQLDTHCRVLERRADIECGDTMIYTMEN